LFVRGHEVGPPEKILHRPRQRVYRRNRTTSLSNKHGIDGVFAVSGVAWVPQLSQPAPPLRIRETARGRFREALGAKVDDASLQVSAPYTHSTK
jgi:hypothetical protein